MENVALFEQSYDKLTKTQNMPQPQKEKTEEVLKKLIKKLQKDRDSIKSWMGQGDIKDKAPLMDKRKLIETVRTNSSSTAQSTLTHLQSVWRGSKQSKKT